MEGVALYEMAFMVLANGVLEGRYFHCQNRSRA